MVSSMNYRDSFNAMFEDPNISDEFRELMTSKKVNEVKTEKDIKKEIINLIDVWSDVYKVPFWEIIQLLEGFDRDRIRLKQANDKR